MLQQPEPAGRGIQEAVVVQAQEQEFWYLTFAAVIFMKYDCIFQHSSSGSFWNFAS